jgi:hypothetical protein
VVDVVLEMEGFPVEETWIVDEEEVEAEIVAHQEEQIGFQIILLTHQWPVPEFLWETYPPMTLDSLKSC